MLNFDKLKEKDEFMYNLNMEELKRQQEHIELIASENIPDEAVLNAQQSYATLKYSEGYPNENEDNLGKSGRYYMGCSFVDKIENECKRRAKELFNTDYHVNVQPHSGANANTAVQFGFVPVNGKIMGMSLNSGGHLTHSNATTISSKHYQGRTYEVNKDTFLIDYDELEKEIREFRPRLFIAGASAYSRIIDFKRIRELIDRVNEEIYNEIKTAFKEGELNEKLAFGYIDQNKSIEENFEKHKVLYMVDMAHIAGLIATGLHPTPFGYADFVTSTTHKTLRSTRGGVIFCKPEYAKKLDSAVFPGTQGGPLQHLIMAKGVGFKLASEPEYKEYCKQVVKNAKVMEETFKEYKINMVTGGTDNHLILLDLRNNKNVITDEPITGKLLEEELEKIGIICNRNSIPFDETNKLTTSGIRIGTPAMTSRGMKEAEAKQIAIIISCVIKVLEINGKLAYDELKEQVKSITDRFPLYQD